MNTPESLPPFAARLEPARRELESYAMVPLIEDLSTIASLNSGVLFVADGGNRHSAGAVALAYAPGRNDEFTNTNIKGHRVDIHPATTTVGKTFETHRSEISPSIMNPDGHVVWGAYMSPVGNSEAAVLQLAFDKSKPLPSEKNLADVWKKYEESINEATEALILANRNRPSLLYDLLLKEAESANGIVVKWDISKSTQMVDEDYSMFNHYIQELEQLIDLQTKVYGGRIVSLNGDGQNIVVDLPADINRNNPVEIVAYGLRTAKPLLRAILAANAQISPSYGKLEPHIRISLGLGHVELSRSGEETGKVFWDVDKTLKLLPRDVDTARLTDIARRALSMARQYK
jgi:hypothetical protein